MTLFTQGKWGYNGKLTASENSRGYQITINDPERKRNLVIADVVPIDSDGIEGEANARLIAAAPYMFDTLQQISRGICLDQRNGDKCICYSCIAKAAIAKATNGKV